MVQTSHWQPTQRLHRFLVGMGFLAVFVIPTTGAGQYYRWVDSSGNLYLGDRPPPGGGVGTSHVPIPDYAAPERSPEDDSYSILNQTKRLEEQRQALTREREEKRRAEREYLLRKRELEATQQPLPQQTWPLYVYPQIYYDRQSYGQWYPRPHHPQSWSGGRHPPGDRYQTHRPTPRGGATDRRLYLGQ